MTMKLRVSSKPVEMYPDSIGPDSLKAAFIVAVDELLARTTAAGQAVAWETVTLALFNPNPDTTSLILRAELA